MKFGGTSVGNFNAVSRTIDIIKSRKGLEPVVCVSALSGVTDQLYKIVDAAAYSGISKAMEMLAALRERHLCLAEALLSDSPDDFSKASVRINELCDGLSAVVASIAALGELPDRIKAVAISFGELLSSSIIHFAMNRSGIRTAFVDARQIVITDSDYMKGVPDMEEIGRRAPEVIEDTMRGHDAVITQGFIAATASGAGTVLGRGGSDYTASLIGAACGADRIEIWTDVDGIRTTDPRIVRNTKRIDKVSFAEAAEMAAYGAKVLHPMTIAPAVSKNIPILVLNSMEPDAPGTTILKECMEDGVKAIAFKVNIYLIEFDGITEEVLKDHLRRHKIKTDILVKKEGNKFILTVDFSQAIVKVVEELAEECEITMRTGFSQISLVGSELYNMKDLVSKAVTDCSSAHSGNGASLIETSEVTKQMDSMAKFSEVTKQLDSMAKFSEVKAYKDVIIDTASNFSFILPRYLLGESVRKLHRLLFEN